MIINYYQILGIDSKATPEEIKKSYRKYASKFHPDKHNGDSFFEEKFKEIQEAYDTLSDEVKRKEYDGRINKVNMNSSYADSFYETGNSNTSKSSSSYQSQHSSSDNNTFSKTDNRKNSDPEKISKRNSNITIGFVTGILFIVIMQIGGNYGMHVPFAIILLIITIRQIFVVFASFLGD